VTRDIITIHTKFSFKLIAPEAERAEVGGAEVGGAEVEGAEVEGAEVGRAEAREPIIKK